MSDSRGRPRTSSRAALEEAALELFLEQGYTPTTIDQITSRAGVSRATFFNYFSSKADLLWVEVDDALDSLGDDIDRGASLDDALDTLAARVAEGFPPLIASHQETIGAAEEIRQEAGARVIDLADVIARSGVEIHRVWIVTGAIVQAALAWSGAGAGREHPREYLRLAAADAPEILGDAPSPVVA